MLGRTLKAGETAAYEPDPGRHAYLFAAKGAVEVNGVRLETRDGAAAMAEAVLSIKAIADADVVLVDAA